MRILSGQCAGSEPGGKRDRKYVREPNDSTRSCTNLFKPWMMAATEITDATPITIPVTVNAERTLRERNVSIATRKFSRACDKDMMAIYSDLKATIGSRRDARTAG